MFMYAALVTAGATGAAACLCAGRSEPQPQQPPQPPLLEPESEPEPEPLAEVEPQPQQPQQPPLPEPEPEPEPQLAADLTIIVTTSPTNSNPSTRLTAAVVRSLALVDGLAACPKTIVCDGYICAAKRNYKKGRIDASDVAAYEQYQRNLVELIATEPAFVDTRLLVLEKRHGFAFAVRRALETVTTRFVLVVQHDRMITRPFDMKSVLQAFDAVPGVKYIAFQTRQTVEGAHEVRVRSRANGKHVVFPPPVALATGDPAHSLSPMAFWYDSTHVCETTHYREFVFQETLRRAEKIVDVDGSRTRLKLGDFVEDTVGHQLLDAVKASGCFESAHAPYGTYLWNDGEAEVHVRHIDGRKYLSPEQREELGYSQHGLTTFESLVNEGGQKTTKEDLNNCLKKRRMGAANNETT